MYISSFQSSRVLEKCKEDESFFLKAQCNQGVMIQGKLQSEI